jgi:hypothetical protein
MQSTNRFKRYMAELKNTSKDSWQKEHKRSQVRFGLAMHGCSSSRHSSDLNSIYCHHVRNSLGSFSAECRYSSSYYSIYDIC